LYCSADLQLVMTIGFRMAKFSWDIRILSKNSKIERPRDKMDSLLPLRHLRLDGWWIWPKQLHIWAPTPYFILETPSLFFHDPPKLQKPPYGNFLEFLKFKNLSSRFQLRLGFLPIRYHTKRYLGTKFQHFVTFPYFSIFL
jgi:hypothetical protein